jgi:hypothetical protein
MNQVVKYLAVAMAMVVSLTANAALTSAQGGEVVVDSTLSVMWANVMVTGVSWPKAQTWVNSLNAANYAGYHNWQLPTGDAAYTAGGSGWGPGLGFGASTSATANQLSYLFINELGNSSRSNTGFPDTGTMLGPAGAAFNTTNTGIGTLPNGYSYTTVNAGLENGEIWSGTQNAGNPNFAWFFGTNCSCLSSSVFFPDEAMAVRPLTSNSACQTVGSIILCTLVPICDISCGIGSEYRWTLPSFGGSDPWLNGFLLVVRPIQEQLNNVAANLSVSVEARSFSLTQTGPQSAATALFADHDRSDHKVFVIAPLVVVTSARHAPPVAKLSLPYQAEALPAGALLRMVKFDAPTRRWVDVGTQSTDAGKHIITANVPAEGRFTVVAEVSAANH